MLPFNPEQVDQVYWRDDPWRTQEQLFDLGIPQHMVSMQDYIERALRVELQQTAFAHSLRVFLYNQLSYNNYQNDDWWSMVMSVSEVADMYCGWHRQQPQQAVATAIDRLVRIRIALNVQRFPGLTNYMNAQQVNDVQVMARDAQILSQEVDQYLAGQQPQPAPYPQQQQYPASNPHYHQPHASGPAARVAAGQPHPNSRQPYHQPQQQQGIRRLPPTPAPSGVQQLAQPQHQQGSIGRRVPGVVPVAPVQPQQPVAAGIGRKPPQTVTSHFTMEPEAPTPVVEVYQGADSFFTEVPTINPANLRRPALQTTPVAPAPVEKEIVMEEVEVEVVQERVELQTNPLPPLTYFYEDPELNIEDHALPIKRAVKPDTIIRGLPVFEMHEANDEVVVNQDWLDTTHVRSFGLIQSTNFDTAAELVSFASASIADGVVAEFPMVLTTPFFVESPESLLKECQCLQTQLQNTPSVTEVLRALERVETLSWRMARDLTDRLTAACNRFLRLDLGLDMDIDSFREDYEALEPYLKENYGVIVSDAFRKGLPQILLSVRGLTTDGPEEFVQHNLKKILEPIDKVFAVAGDPVRIVLEELPEGVEPLANLLKDVHQNIVNMVSCEYLSILPMTLEDTGLMLAIGDRRLVGENKSTQEFSDFLDDVDARARRALPLLHATYVQTCDGALLRFRPNQLGFDKLYAIERLA